MSDYQLYCFGESGHSYKVALYMELTGLDWEAIHMDFFKGANRTEDYLKVNSMGEAPVLIHGDLTLSQSGVILDYLIEETGKFAPATKEDAREVLRWVLWDNHKMSSQIGVTRFLMNFLPEHQRQEAVIAFLQGRTKVAYKLLNAHLEGRDWIVGTAPTAADFSNCSYLYYPEPFGFERTDWPNIDRWLTNISEIDGWKHPYDLMQPAFK